MINKVLIANRGEIACRIIRSCRNLGISTVAVYSDADRRALFVEMADEAISIGGTTPAESYLRGDVIIEAALRTGADAVHPGYGFLSENPDFATAVEKAGLRFVGPPASAIRAMGLKDAAKSLMEKAGVPVVPGYHGDVGDPDFLLAEAVRIGFPVLIKARAGGGGKGMRRVEQSADFKAALESASREAEASFGDPACLIEKYVSHPRHIEIQVFADDHGNVVHLFERDCSLQRRHQKVIEEAPAPGMPNAMRDAMGEAAVKAARAIGYSGAGTVEFIADASEGLRLDRFWFMEMNTRLQVEHPVTEAITGVDLVDWQLQVASGARLPKTQDELSINGWAFEARLYAEDPERDFLPATGQIQQLELPDDLARIDSGVRAGDVITPFYDPMIAKVIVHGNTRKQALGKLTTALSRVRVAGTLTNASFLTRLSRQPDFMAGNPDTGLIARHLATLTAAADVAPELTAVAAMALTGRLDPEHGANAEANRQPDPWTTLAGFRLWSNAREHVSLIHRSNEIDVVLEIEPEGMCTAEIGGETVRFGYLKIGRDLYRVSRNGHDRKLDVIVDGTAVTLYVDDISARFSLNDLLAQTGSSHAGGSTVSAPMPGLVKRLSVSLGQVVKAGDPLLVMEAMKMELTLSSPRDGVIAEIRAAGGEQVSEGTVLVLLEPMNG